MSNSPLMFLGLKAMAANYAGLQTTGHNIANANVAGYSRQEVQLATAKGQFSDGFFLGRGVDVSTVTRGHDEFLTREAANSKSLSAMDAARVEQLHRIEEVFKPGDNGLGAAISDLRSALSDLTSQPADLATRQVVLARTADFAARFREAGAALDDSQTTVTAALGAAISDVNSIAASIGVANQQIVSLQGLGQPANDLLDERDRLLSRLSAHFKVTSVESNDGSVAVFIGGGQQLVAGRDAKQLQLVPDPGDTSRTAISFTDGKRPIEPASLGGGSVAGLLRFQNQDLVDARNNIGRLVAALGGKVNEQQQRGISLQSPLGQVLGSPLFSFGAPQALANASNARDANGSPIGSVALTITDPTALQASDYTLAESAASPTGWQLTRLLDGVTTNVASGDVVDGVRIDFGTPPPQPGDRFLLQPVARAANGLTRLLNDPRDLAAASQLVATANAANTGTAAVDTLVVDKSPLPFPGATTSLTFTSNTGDYNWQVADASGSVLAAGSAVWQAGQSVPPAPTDFNGFTLTLRGVPRSGDVISVLPTPAAAMASNSGNALAMVQLSDQRFVGGRTADDNWAQMVSEVGARVLSAQSAADISSAAAGQAEAARSSTAGVNLDEEAARLIQYQQSYQAAAKLLMVAQTLLDKLLEATSH